MKRLHFITGIATVLVFFGTGLYMNLNFPDLYRENETIRYMFRANHVYLLFSGLMNLLLGLSGAVAIVRWKILFQSAGSWIILVSPFLFLAAFVLEPPQASPVRPITLVAVFLSLLGVAAHLVGGYDRSPRAQSSQE